MARSPAGNTFACSIGRVHAYRREQDQAFQWLEKCVALREYNAVTIRDSPMFAALRTDPRYASLMRAMKLPADAGPATGGNP